MTRRPTLAVLLALLVVSGFSSTSSDRSAFASVLSANASQAAGQAPAVPLDTLIGNLASLDYETRTHAARLIRRVDAKQAVPTLTAAVRKHSDEFVRYRALVLLTALGDRGTRDLMVSLLRDRNDRVREVAYKWLERNPDPALANTLLAALQTEQAEFVRPALVAALAAVDDDAAVQRALMAESMRGLDFFREAVIESLGRQRAQYAIETIAGITRLDGPLRRSAIVALGRIGGARAREVLAEVAKIPGEELPAIRAAQCMADDVTAAGSATARPCDPLLKALIGGATGPGSAAALRGSVDGLTAIAEGAGGPAFGPSSVAALEALIGIGSKPGVVRDQAALGVSAVALRRPGAMVAWLDAAPEGLRTQAVVLLRQGFERLEEDFAEEQFYAAARAAYWAAPEGSPTRTLSAALIERLEF